MAEYIKDKIEKDIHIADIIIGSRITGTDEENIDGLITSILEIGLTNRILVTPNNNGTYRLLAGNHRIKAFQIMNKEVIPAVVFYLKDELTFEQREAVFNMIEITENFHRKKLAPSELFKMEQKLVDCKLIFPKNLNKAKKELKGIDQLIEIAEGEAKKDLKKRKEKLVKSISEEKVFDLREALLKLGLTTREVNNLEYLYNECYTLFGNGESILKKLESADIEKRLYGVLVRECKDSADKKNLLNKILINDDSTIRMILNDIEENQREAKQNKKKPKDTPKSIKLEKIHDSHYKIITTEKTKCDFICRAEEDVFIRRAGYEVIYFEWSNKALLGQIHSGIQSEFNFLCISSNKRDLDRLINNIVNKYKAE